MCWVRGSGNYDRKKKDSRLSDGLCSPSPWFFFGLGVMNDAAKTNCIFPIGDDGSLNRGCSSGKLIIIKINTES